MLQKSVLATTVYYDILNYPLTEFELWKHLIQPSESGEVKTAPALGEVSQVVSRLVSEGKLSRFRSFIIIPGHEALVEARIHDEKRAVQKISRATRLIRLISWVPYVRMIGLTGSLSLKQGDPASDWDFFVVLREGAIWRGRVALSFVLQLLGKRRHGQHVENRACLNHFVTDASLEIALQDFFSAHEYRFMYPIFDVDTHRRFELANRWMMHIKPAFTLTEIPVVWSFQSRIIARLIQRVFERCLDFTCIEALLADWQQRKIKANPKTRLPGAFIVANEKALIFLPHPKGPVIFERFKQALSAL